MRILFFLLFTLAAAYLPAQDLPFIKSDQIGRWKTAANDTVYVINFWATWCQPCVEELPAFEKLHREYAGQKVQVVLVNTDFKKQVETSVKSFLRRKKLESQVVFMDEPTPNKWIDLVDPSWSGSLPATLIIGKDRSKLRFFEKKLTYDELEAALKEVGGL